MQHADRRKEPVGQAGKAFPIEERFLAAPFERLQPAPSDFFKEPPQARIVARDRKVVEVPSEHPSYPGSSLRDGIMHPATQRHLDCPEGGDHPLLDRLAPDDKRAPFA